MPYTVIMNSVIYGQEEYSYGTFTEAYEGIVRLAQQVAELNDEIARNFFVYEEGLDED